MRKTILQLTTALALVTMAGAAQAADCKITVGLVMELTGPAGPSFPIGAGRRIRQSAAGSCR